MDHQSINLNLLFGVLARRLELIDEVQFADACSAWMAARNGSLADLLLGRGWVTAEDRSLIERLIRHRLDRHGGDAHRALASVADRRLAASLAGVHDPDLPISPSEYPTDPGVTPLVVFDSDRPDQTRAQYSLVRLHARGGLGRVWLARDPVLGRTVALKEILPERADDPAQRACFLAEARVTGQLEHPSIVPVYELCRRPEDGRPFYTMRMVRGRTLSAAVRQHHARKEGSWGGNLGLSGLLNAFVAVCNAIAYAHSRGVIHRDLKGQNIVLGDYGEVIVLDWGLAKLIGYPEGDRVEPTVMLDPEGDAALTLQGQAVGTPGYMAPEQADGRQDLVGPATDIYGLGAVLYEILTGRPPYESCSPPEAVRQVRQRDPIPPRRVRSAKPAALEAICLKALARRPEARYASASELADDVRRWLADEPVSAWREPAAARWARWGRRHRSAAIAAAALLLVVLVALGVGITLVGRERSRAEAHFRLARDGAGRIYYEILDEPPLGWPGMDELRHKILRSVQEYYRELAAARPDDPELAEHLGWSYLRLARATLQLGEADRADGLARMGLGALERLVKDRPGVARYRSDLAHAHFELGQIERYSGRFTDADASLAAAAAIWRDLDAGKWGHPHGPELAAAYNQRGAVNLALGRTDLALELDRTALNLLEDRIAAESSRSPERELLSRRADCRAALAAVHVARREWPQAEASYLQARRAWEALLAESPSDSDSKRLGYALEGLSRVYEATGRIPVAERTLREALAIWDRLAAEHPAVVEYTLNRAKDRRLFGELHDPSLHSPGDPDRAAREYERALEILESLEKRGPQPIPGARDLQERALTRLSHLYDILSKPDLAGQYRRRAEEARRDERRPGDVLGDR
jgi:serine/threonine protein kinase